MLSVCVCLFLPCMKKIFGLLAAAITLVSCIEVSEEISITKSGSGTYQNTVDVSQMKTLVESMKSDSMKEAEGGVDSFHLGMVKSLKESSEKYNAVPGISNVKFSSDQVNAKYTVSFQFDNVKALNKALSEGAGVDKYQWNKGKFVVKGSGFNPLGGDDENAEMMKMMLADAKYNLKITVPKKVKKVSNDKVNISGRTAELNTTFGDWLGESGTPNFTVTYK
jgi:hypothetical protein